MQFNKLLYTAVIFTSVGMISTILIFFAKGYKISPEERVVEKTGWILVKSAPDGAKTYLNGKAVNPTNTSIGSLKSGTYTLKIIKDGYHEWKKNVLVKEEFVTIVDALLIKRAAEIKPITLTGVKEPTADDSLTQIAFYTAWEDREGIWVYSLANSSFIAASRTNPRLVAEGSEFRNLTQIDWSPNSSEIIVTFIQGDKERSVLLSLERSNIRPYSTIDRPKVLADWNSERQRQREELVKQLKLPERYRQIALSASTKFSPDEKKFLYQEKSGEGIEYHVFNLTKPLPIGYRTDTVVLRQEPEEELQVLWHSTSEHLLIVEEGTISIIEIDGLNKTPIFSADLSSGLVVPSPNGRYIIVSTAFTKDASPNLYSLFFN